MLFSKRQISTRKTRMFNMNANAKNNSQIDFNLLPKNCPSLCIPRVFANIGEARIRKIFEDISIGRIEEIDIIKGNKNNRVFIYLTWNNTPDAQFVRNQVMTGKDVKIIYDEPWFWMISAARNQSSKPEPPQPQLSHKTDEFGRELRQAQPPLPKPILQRQVCYHEVPPPPPPAPLQRQKACFEPPRQYQQQPSNYHQHRQQPPPPPPPRRNNNNNNNNQSSNYHQHRQYHQPRQEQQQTDQFGREIRRQAPPPPPPPPPAHYSFEERKPSRKPWHEDEYDEDEEDDDDDFNKKELNKIKDQVAKEQEQAKEKQVSPPPPPPPRFIPQSPTSTPPCLRRKQIQQEPEEQEEQEPEDQEEQEDQEEEEAPRPPKMDVDHMTKPFEINYGSVLPIKRIRKPRRTVTQ